jgi:hypothetical protein
MRDRLRALSALQARLPFRALGGSLEDLQKNHKDEPYYLDTILRCAT